MTITITYPDDNRRPDILLRNPFGGGRQVILDVAVTGVDGSDRKVEDHPDQPMIKRARQNLSNGCVTSSIMVRKLEESPWCAASVDLFQIL